jgi:DNA polymerase-3 subunit epsilon
VKGLLQRLLGAGPQVSILSARWVAIDCETSGLNPARDRLLAVGAVAVREARIEPADSFHALVRQEAPSSAENILIHGIGADAQRAGRPREEVLGAFTRYLGDGLPVAFHAGFDSTMLGIAGPWLDLARLAPVLYPERARTHLALDDWLEACHLTPAARHDALADAFSAAQLLLVLLAEAGRQGVATVPELRRVAASGRWIAGR